MKYHIKKLRSLLEAFNSSLSEEPIDGTSLTYTLPKKDGAKVATLLKKENGEHTFRLDPPLVFTHGHNSTSESKDIHVPQVLLRTNATKKGGQSTSLHTQSGTYLDQWGELDRFENMSPKSAMIKMGYTLDIPDHLKYDQELY